MDEAGVAIIVHGGATSPKAYQDGCEAAARLGLLTLKDAGSALDAAINSVAAMEDDGRFNAGRGSAFCLDGSTVEMDAAIMDSTGCLGAVACIQRVKNPILIARAISQTPHWMLTGEGAERFARQLGFAAYFAPSQEAAKAHDNLMKALLSGPHEHASFSRHWNYSLPWEEAIKRYGSGTVGAVVRDSEGNFAVATSTGGCTPSLLGRVGDTPVIGCGFYAGPSGAVAATGVGEYIVRQMLAKTVYQWIEQGVPAHAAVDRGVALFDDSIDVGLIAVSEKETAVSSNRDMPYVILKDGDSVTAA